MYLKSLSFKTIWVLVLIIIPIISFSAYFVLYGKSLLNTETYKISRVGTIAGCMVMDGKITRNSMVRIVREGVVVYTGSLASLKRFKDDVKEVTKGYDCGLQIKDYNDIKIGDTIEAYIEIAVKKKLK